MDFQVHRDGSTRLEGLVTVALDLPQEFPVHTQLVELDGFGSVMHDQVPFQIDPAYPPITPTLLHFWMLPNPAKPAVRFFRLYLDACPFEGKEQPSQVILDEAIVAGQAAYRIHTPCADYAIQLENGGLASLVDPEGQDWISYNTAAGSAGEYRGIPNIKYPDGYLHPGKKNAQCFLLSDGPLSCHIYVRSLDGQCDALWLFTPQYAQLTLLSVPTPYWFLYEGTPGGAVDEDDGYVVRSNGVKTPVGMSWEDVLDPGWLYFGSSCSPRVLCLSQLEIEHKTSSYWLMEKNMTVFGFGRRKLEHYLEKCPAQFRIGLLEAGDFQYVQDQVQNVMGPLFVKQTTGDQEQL